MNKKKKIKKVKQKAQNALILEVRTKMSNFWWPLPYDKREKQILSSVDCLFNQDYYDRDKAKEMLKSL